MTGEAFGNSTARVATERPARYAKQLVSHFGAHTEGHWSADEGRGTFSFIGEGAGAENPKRAYDGRVNVSLVTAETMLLIHVEGPDALIPRFEQVVGSHLVRFGAKDGLTVSWRRGNGEEGSTQTAQEELLG